MSTTQETDLVALHFHDQGRLAALILLGPGTVLESLLEHVGKVDDDGTHLIVHVPARWHGVSQGELALLGVLRSFSSGLSPMPSWDEVGWLDAAERRRVAYACGVRLAVAP